MKLYIQEPYNLTILFTDIFKIYFVVCRYKEYSVIKSTQDAVHKMVEEKINECSHWQQVHKVGVWLNSSGKFGRLPHVCKEKMLALYLLEKLNYLLKMRFHTTPQIFIKIFFEKY